MIGWEDVKNEDLRVGDTVLALGIKRITAIRAYHGPHRDIIFAIVDTVPGVGFSLEKGGYTRRLDTPKDGEGYSLVSTPGPPGHAAR